MKRLFRALRGASAASAPLVEAGCQLGVARLPFGSMPCGDVTELVQIELDDADRLQQFSLQKQTCGAPVGNALLLSYAQGLRAEQIMGQSLSELVPGTQEARHLDQFLLAKQLYALQSALEVYLGAASGAKDAPFALATIEHDAGATSISGLLRVDLATEAIRACGNCGAAPRASE